MGDVVTMDDLTNEEIISILDAAERLLPVAKGDVFLPLLQGKVLANMFFENSTRTRMSFESAMKRLGGSVLNFSSVGTSVAKGETLYDTMKMIEGYADVAAIRHSRQGAAQYSADAVDIPVLNAGDGAGNHPQTRIRFQPDSPNNQAGGVTHQKDQRIGGERLYFQVEKLKKN